MKYTEKIATAIQEYLINLALEGELDGFDYSQLNLLPLIESVPKDENPDNISNAGMILFEDEITIQDQIKLIKENKDQLELIDYVEGVSVSHACTYTYTCKDFLDMLHE